MINISSLWEGAVKYLIKARTVCSITAFEILGIGLSFPALEIFGWRCHTSWMRIPRRIQATWGREGICIGKNKARKEIRITAGLKWEETSGGHLVLYHLWIPCGCIPILSFRSLKETWGSTGGLHCQSLAAPFSPEWALCHQPPPSGPKHSAAFQPPCHKPPLTCTLSRGMPQKTVSKPRWNWGKEHPHSHPSTRSAPSGW